MPDDSDPKEQEAERPPQVRRVPARTSSVSTTLAILAFGATVLTAAFVASLQMKYGPPQLLFLIPVPVVVGLVIYGVVSHRRRSAVFRRISEHARTADLAEARRKDADAFCAGRLRCKAPLTAPHLHSPCAAYVARERSGPRAVSTVSCVAAGELETEEHGAIPLLAGEWEVYDPFDTEVMEGVATVHDGDMVVVRARVDERIARGTGYRGASVEYSLRADNGFLAPASGRFTERESTLGMSPLVLPLIVTMAVTGAATFLILARRQEQRSVPAPEAATTVAVEAANRCDQTLKCTDGRLCDVETMTCAKAIAGRVLEGQPCTARGQCAAGSRCASSFFDGSKEPRCRRACMTDAQCGTGWCVPCGDVKRSAPGECVDPAKLEGAIGEVCKMTHALVPSSAPASASISPPAPSAP